MSNNIFVIERGGNYWEGYISDDNGNPIFMEFLDMNYDEMKSSDQLESFVATAMVVADNVSSTVDEQTIINLIDENQVFIWGILIGPGDGDNIRYMLIDWKKDDKIYKYES